MEISGIYEEKKNVKLDGKVDVDTNVKNEIEINWESMTVEELILCKTACDFMEAKQLPNNTFERK